MADAEGASDTNGYAKMKVVELKKILKERGLAISGTKDELIERLRQANEEKKLLEETIEAGETQPNPPSTIDQDLEDEIMNEENTGDKVGDKKEGAAEATDGDGATIKKGEDNKENDKVTEAQDEAGPPSKVIKLSTVTPEQKKELRAKKFGLSEDEKKEARAKRFGISPQTNTPSPLLPAKKSSPVKGKESDELLKKRAMRFGLLSDKQLTPEELEKRKKRAERFGTGGITVETKK